MEMYKSKFLYIAEVTFYIMYVSFLVTLTGVLIFTLGTSITAGYYVVKVLKEHHYSMSIKELTLRYFKEFVRKIVPTTIATLWFIMSVIAIFNIPNLINVNVVTLAVVIFFSIEISILFQIIFYIFAMNDRIKYLDATIKALILAHRYVFIMLFVSFTAVVLAIGVGMFPWTIILAPGLQIYITQKIFSSKGMEQYGATINL